MSKWYENKYRRNLLDMHIEAWDESFLSEFSPEEYVKNIKTANVQVTMLYLNSHVGYCYWPTKNGYMHSGFKGEDRMGEIIDMCHKEGIDVVGYYSLIFDNWAYENHKDWRMLDINGMGSREPNPIMSPHFNPQHRGRYGLCCPNNKEYREFTFGQIKEICDRYQLEGLFYDMTFWPMICYCPSCQQRYREETGREIPKEINWSDPEWLNFQRKREEWISEFAHTMTTEFKKHKPNASVQHNYALAMTSWLHASTEAIAKECDYVGGDLYGDYIRQSFCCKLYYGISQNQPFEHMSPRCYPDLTEHTSMKSKDMLKLHNYLTLAHHGAFLFIDAVDPKGTMNSRVYETLGEVFRESMDYEKYLKGDMCIDVGIYFSLRAKMDPSVHAVSHNYPQMNAAIGATKALKEHHIPYGIINNSTDYKDLSRLKVLILPEVVTLSESERHNIKEFMKNGGSVYASGRTDPEFIAEILGAEYEGMTEETVTYIAPDAKGAHLMPDFDYNSPLSVKRPQLMMKGVKDEDVLAVTVLPYTRSTDINKFASIHSNPPDIVTNYPAVVKRSYGRGRLIWVSASLEAIERANHHNIFVNMIRELCNNDFSFEIDGAPAIEAVMFNDSRNNRYLISLVNLQDTDYVLPVHDISVKIKVRDVKPVKALRLPCETAMDYKVEDAFAVIRIDRLELFEMIALDYEK